MKVDVVARPEPKRDRYGRYLIPDPDTGRERAWTRVTTLADTLDDRYNLEKWKVRTAAIGLASRPDLLAMIAAHHHDKARLDRVCADALEAGKASEGANLGTALHALTEQLDRGVDMIVPPQLRADLDAYQATMRASGLTIATLPDGSLAREVIVLCAELGVAGTADHIFTGDRHVIGDLKTGASAIEWAMTSIAIQLAVYAHASHVFDPVTGEVSAAPPMNLDRAVIIHLPVGQGRCDLYDVDIAAGWDAALHAAWVREWRKRRDLAAPHALPRFAAVAPAARRKWLAERCSALRNVDGAADVLAALWPPGVAGFKTGHVHDGVELDAVEAVLVRVERDFDAPFVPGPGSGGADRDLVRSSFKQEKEKK